MAPKATALHHIEPINWKLPFFSQVPSHSKQGAQDWKASWEVLVVHLPLGVMAKLETVSKVT